MPFHRIAIVFAVAALVGCGDDPSSSSGRAGNLLAGKQPFPSAGLRDSFQVAGSMRTWYLVPPKPADSTKLAELVVYFHGYGGSGYESGRWNLGEPGRVTVYPDGVVQTWYQNAIGWDNRSNTSPDVLFTAALLDTLLARYPIDRSRVYVTGFSWGGWMANAAGCALGHRLAGMVSAAGGGPEGSQSSCKASLPVAILHATNDNSEPQSSGIRSRDFWRTKNRCTTDTATLGTHGCGVYQGCTKPVVWCSHAEGHSAPSWWLSDAWAGFGR